MNLHCTALCSIRNLWTKPLPQLLLCISAEETFDDAVSRMGSVLGRSSVDVEAFSGLARRAKEIDAANRKKDEDYDDAPDEFIGEFKKLAFIV